MKYHHQPRVANTYRIHTYMLIYQIVEYVASDENGCFSYFKDCMIHVVEYEKHYMKKDAIYCDALKLSVDLIHVRAPDHNE